MERLVEGYHRFRAQGWPGRRTLFERLAEGQAPRALVLACADSRVDPAMIFDAAPGEIFVVRNVANLVPPCERDAAYHGTSAAIEFGVRELEVRDLVVMGHGMCGGVRALLEGVPEGLGDFVGPWISIARRARERALTCEDVSARRRLGEEETVRVSLDNLMTFPWIAQRVRDGRLRLHGTLFDIRSGILEVMGPDGAFRPA